MEYDFGKRNDSQIPNYSRPSAGATSSPAHAMYGQPQSLYPKVGGSASHSTSSFSATGPGRNPPGHHAPSPPFSSGIGIRVAIKPEYRITPPPQLLPQVGEVLRCNFHYDFEFERNVLAEALKENPNWSRLGIEIVPPKTAGGSNSSYGPTVDPVVSKYVASGLNRDAVPIAVANYGDNPAKVKEFSNGYNLLREMGFPSNNVADALLMFDNDTDKALAHVINSSS